MEVRPDQAGGISHCRESMTLNAERDALDHLAAATTGGRDGLLLDGRDADPLMSNGQTP